jgi:hypothetical protein
VSSSAESPFSGLLSAKRVEIETFFSLDPQVPFRMYAKVGPVDETSALGNCWK